MKRLLITVAVFLLFLGVGAGFLFRPVSYEVERSIVIEVPAEKLFGVIHDFHEWSHWSPWLVLEPDPRVTVTGDGKSVGDIYRWDGKMVGQGELEHKVIEVSTHTEMELRVIDPYPSEAKVEFRVEAVSGDPARSTATWKIDGKVPSMMREMMEAWIGMDYDRGLGMLKQYCETGKVITRVEVPGEVERPAMSYLGIKHDCDFTEISDSMGEAFEELKAKLEAGGIKLEGSFLAIYTGFDLVNNHIDYMAAYPVPSQPATLPDGVVHDEMPAHRAFQVNHIGDVQNIGNGWSAGTMHLQVKGMKQSKSVMPYELMPVDLSGIPEAETRVEIFYPLR